MVKYKKKSTKCGSFYVKLSNVSIIFSYFLKSFRAIRPSPSAWKETTFLENLGTNKRKVTIKVPFCLSIRGSSLYHTAPLVAHPNPVRQSLQDNPNPLRQSLQDKSVAVRYNFLSSKGRPHVESFNFMLGDGLKLAVEDLKPLEFQIPENGARWEIFKEIFC